MQIRKDPLVTGSYYHIYSRSIAGYVVFNDTEEFSRFLENIDLYQHTYFGYRFSKFKQLDLPSQQLIIQELREKKSVLVDIVAYCIMPTHTHFILKQSTDHGISKYIAKILNSYTRYFNTKHKRGGPLWSGRFRSVLVSNDEQLLHLTRYLHLNPTSAGLVKEPDDWPFSSYGEYVNSTLDKNEICSTKYLFDTTPAEYEKFVLERKDYQRDLSKIKKLRLDNYTG